jgi:hypothetical protein
MTITKTLLFIASLASGVVLAQQAPSSTGEYYAGENASYIELPVMQSKP